MEKITNQSVWEEIEAIATDAINEATWASGIAKEDIEDIDDIREDAEQYLWETCGGHEWVIYYSRAWEVSNIMRADDAACNLFEELAFDVSKGLDDAMTKFAFCALYANATQMLEEAFEAMKGEN